MKTKYLITGLLASVIFIFAGCESPDDLVRTDGDLSSLVVSGRLVSDESKEYAGTVDMTAGTVLIQVPYYISDTEPIQGDLSQMKLSASLPLGAKFIEGLAGIHDLQAGIRRTLLYEDGTTKTFTISAVYVRSNIATVTRVSLEGAPTAPIVITDPEEDGDDGSIVVYNTGALVASGMTSATITVSPWATFDITPATALNADGTVDLTGSPDIIVTAQDGTVVKYTTTNEMPAFVPSGQMGYMTLLFGFQALESDPRGFRPAENRTMAIVDDHLIVSSTSLNFIVYNRFTGEHLEGVVVNTTGLPNGFIHAITNDEADHMIAITIAAANNQYIANSQFEIYAWKNGITSAPEKVFSEDIFTGTWLAALWSSNAAVTAADTWDIGRTVGFKGDITGEGLLMTLASSPMTRMLRVRFDAGVVTDVTGSAWGLSVWGNQCKLVPLSTSITCPFIEGDASSNRRVFYANQEVGASANVTFSPRGDWWATTNIGVDYIEFNGMQLVGIQNGYNQNAPNLLVDYCRLCVGDISSMAPNAFTTSQIMDSRLDNYDPSFGPVGPGGQNSSITGMTSSYLAVGSNPNTTGDVRFGKSADGNSVQVYMLTTDHGIIAYELTRYDL